VFSTLVCLFGVYFLLKEKPLAGGIFWGLALLARTTNLIPYLVVFPFLFVGEKPVRSTLWFLMGSLPLIALFLGLNWMQYGSPFTLSYTRVLMMTEQGPVMQDNRGLFGPEYLVSGLWGQLMDKEHGLLYTNAVALVGFLGLAFFFRRAWRSAAYVLLTALSLYVFHAFFRLWYISHTGSNRYLFTAILLMALPLACLFHGVLEISGKIKKKRKAPS
jgi:hypothetical protein